MVSTAAYLLFYRRRSAGPLGPPELQDIVNNWRNPDSEAVGASEEDTASRNASPSGNGLRLGGSSRNGSSSAFAVGTGAGAGALRGGGSALAGSHLQSGAAVGNRSDDSLLPGYDEDEGYGEEDVPEYAPLSTRLEQDWDWSKVDKVKADSDSDNAAFDDDEGRDRLEEDFGDEPWQGGGTPMTVDMETVVPVPAGDDDLAEIHVENHGKQE